MVILVEISLVISWNWKALVWALFIQILLGRIGVFFTYQFFTVPIEFYHMFVVIFMRLQMRKIHRITLLLVIIKNRVGKQ